MPALCGIRLLLSPHAATALGPWLAGDPAYPDSPTIKVDLTVAGRQAPPTVVALLLEESGVWLGRTTHGLLLGNRGQSWFAIEGDQATIHGVIGSDHVAEADRDLLLCALLVALQTIGVYSLHAAALSSGERALVLVGDSGAGKSTTATALAQAGCGYLGDDAILIRKRSNVVELVAYWPSFRLSHDVLASFEELRPYISKCAKDPKWRLDSSSAFPGRHLAHWIGPMTLLFLTRSTKRESSLFSLTSAEATGLLIAQSSALRLDCHPNPRQHLDLLALMTNCAQIARLELGHEWLDDPLGASQRLLEHVGSWSLRERNELP